MNFQYTCTVSLIKVHKHELLENSELSEVIIIMKILSNSYLINYSKNLSLIVVNVEVFYSKYILYSDNI